jgi:hypothetical protein
MNYDTECPVRIDIATAETEGLGGPFLSFEELGLSGSTCA